MSWVVDKWHEKPTSDNSRMSSVIETISFGTKKEALACLKGIEEALGRENITKSIENNTPVITQDLGEDEYYHFKLREVKK